jgi:hypothetical protein
VPPADPVERLSAAFLIGLHGHHRTKFVKKHYEFALDFNFVGDSGKKDTPRVNKPLHWSHLTGIGCELRGRRTPGDLVWRKAAR